MRKFLIFLTFAYLLVALGCSQNPEPEPVRMGLQGSLAAGTVDEIVIEAGDEVRIKVQGLQGKPGEQGPPGTGSGSLPNVINVLNYGAVGDGVTDCTAGFKAAIAACKKGDWLFIPNGRYIVSDELYVDKSIYIAGQGLQTQIYQSTDNHLFHLFKTTTHQGFGGSIVRDMALGGTAASEGKALLFLDHAGYSKIENVAVSGCNYGLYIHGALGTRLHNIRTLIYPNFWKQMPKSKVAIYGDTAYGKNVNHVMIYDTMIQGGAIRGIELHATNAEGGIGIYGGLIEGLLEESVYLTGFSLLSTISGLHCEAGAAPKPEASNVKLVNCRNTSIEGCYLGGNRGLELVGCSRMDIRGGQSNGIYADYSCQQNKFHGINYRSLHLHGRRTRCWDMQNMSDSGVGAYGYYISPMADRFNPNWLLEDWRDGKPVGYYLKGGSVSQEMSVVCSGKSAARLVLTGAVSSLALDLDPDIYCDRSVTIQFYVWIPKGSGIIPRIGLLYNNWNSCTLSPVFNEVIAETWTPISCTFYVPPRDNLRRIQAVLGSIHGGTQAGYMLIDDISMTEFPI